jgi:hypothetical protein
MQAPVRCLHPAAIVAPVLLVVAVACGGHSPDSKSPSRSLAGASESQGGASRLQLPSCEDKTCFACGDGICPTGFYCETNNGVTGCAWLPACVKSPTCICLRPSLERDSRCKCEDRGAVAFVTCGR